MLRPIRQEKRLEQYCHKRNNVINTQNPLKRIASWMSLSAGNDFEIQYRPGSRNENEDYLPRSPIEADVILRKEMEDDLNAAVKYLATRIVTAESSNFAKAIKVHAKNFVIHDRHLHRKNTKGLHFILAEQERSTTIKVLHHEIRHWNFATTYKIMSYRLL